MKNRLNWPSRFGIGLSMLLLIALGAATLVGGCLSAPSHRGPRTATFDGQRFQNEAVVPDKGLLTVLKWRLTSERSEWPEGVQQTGQATPDPEVSGEDRLRVTYVNHSTFLIQLGGLNLLTDPVFSSRVGPYSWIGPERHRTAGVAYDRLPRIHAVLISHNHYDHLDLPTLQRLARDHKPRFLLPMGNRALLDRHDIPGGEDLDWWQSVTLAPGTEATFVPARHWSGRGLSDRNKSLWGGWVIRGAGGRPIFFAGDTGWGPHFEQINRRFGPMRLALLPIGAYKPRWFMEAAHISPEEAVDAHQLLDAGTSVAMHFGTFQLADEGQEEPVEDLRAALKRVDLGGSTFRVLAHGEALDVPRHHDAPAAGEVTAEPSPSCAPVQAAGYCSPM